MSHRTRSSLIAALAAVLVPTTALADSNGNQGSVAKLTVYESGSDNAGMAKGALVVKERKEKNKPDVTTEYKWGGSLCPGRDLSPESIALLFQALQDRKNIKVTPTYKAGNGNTRCLTGFSFDRD